MKRYVKELIIFLVQLFMFYVFPLFAGPTDAMGMVFMIILATFMLSFILGLISGSSIRFAYPAVISLCFIPSVLLYYNASALIHAVWYLVVAAIGLLPGAGIRYLAEIIKHKK